jgi:hypothetical protein
MSTTVTCEACGQSYHDGMLHQCPGTDAERIDALEDRVQQLENERREMWERIRALERNT